MTISENIKNLRLKYGLSQKELGLIAGVTDKAVSTWEQGIKEPRMGAIQKMADHFGIKKSDIIEDQPATTATTAKAIDFSEREMLLIKKYRQLDADGKNRVDYVLNMEFDLMNNSAEKEEESLG